MDFILDTSKLTPGSKRCVICNGPVKKKLNQKQHPTCSFECGLIYRGSKEGEKNPNWRGGKTKHRLYDVYCDMIARCYRPSHKSYKNYGGRGIRVCQKWRNSFWNFVEDVGENTTGKWMDRIDNDGDYEPSNFRWVSASESNKNRRSSATDNRDRDSKGRFIS